MTQEIRIVNRIAKILEEKGATVIKTHGSVQRQGEPDLLICYPIGPLGVTVAIEVKQPGKHPRPLQMSRLRKWAGAGAIAFWTDNSDEVLGIIGAEVLARRNNQTILKDGRPQ